MPAGRITGKELKAYMEWVGDYFNAHTEGDVICCGQAGSGFSQ